MYDKITTNKTHTHTHKKKKRKEKWSLAWWSLRDCKKSDRTEWLSDNMDLQFVSSLQRLSDISENSSVGMTCSSFNVLSPLLRTKSTSWIKAYALIRSSSDSCTRESLRGTALGNGSQTWLLPKNLLREFLNCTVPAPVQTGCIWCSGVLT